MMMVVQEKVHAGRLQISRLGADQRTMLSEEKCQWKYSRTRCLRRELSLSAKNWSSADSERRSRHLWKV
ncbi:hypothetical protein F2P79_003539 [Pimephales promelas]|nr:hypothetical protein F2P79_003539 [Pimephales promelas]